MVCKIDFRSQGNRTFIIKSVEISPKFFPSGSLLSTRTSQSCSWKVAAGAPASLICREFSLSPQVQSKCFPEATAFSYLCTNWLSNLSLYNSPTVSPHFPLDFLILPHPHCNLDPWFILLCPWCRARVRWALQDRFCGVHTHSGLLSASIGFTLLQNSQRLGLHLLSQRFLFLSKVQLKSLLLVTSPLRLGNSMDRP